MNEISQNPNPALPPIIGAVQPSEALGKKRKTKFWVLLVVFAVLIFNPISLFILSLIFTLGWTTVMETRLCGRHVYEPVARTLATYCQSDQNLFPPYLSYAWLPGELERVGHGRCRVSTNAAYVEMGGGFHHFGYILKLDDAASSPVKSVWQLVGRDEVTPIPGTNVWNLFFYSEGREPDKLLMALALAATQQVTAGDLEKFVGAGFDRSIKNGQLGAYRTKVMSQLRFGQTTQAVVTCRDWMKAKPDSWVPRFTYAHVRCRLGETDPASAEFSDWVNAHKNFAHCIYLALFNYREGRTNQAVQAVRLAINQPFEESIWADVNKFYLGENGALIAFAAGDYDLCLAFCNKMLADSGGEKRWPRTVLRIEAAATFMKGDQAMALDFTKQAANADEPVFNRESRAKVDRALLDAIQSKNTEAVRDFGHWMDEMESWYSPFETDETAIHGSGLHIPTPYPETWKSDRMNPNVPP